jgi:hypothetical protein
VPQFAANVIFECVLLSTRVAHCLNRLHQSPAGAWFVRFAYDYDPSATSPTQVHYVDLPRNGNIVDWTKVCILLHTWVPVARSRNWLVGLTS